MPNFQTGDLCGLEDKAREFRHLEHIIHGDEDGIWVDLGLQQADQGIHYGANGRPKSQAPTVRKPVPAEVSRPSGALFRWIPTEGYRKVSDTVQSAAVCYTICDSERASY